MPHGTDVDPTALAQDVVTANHILERFGLSNAFGHASARLPGTNRFLFPRRRSPGLAAVGDLLTLDTEGAHHGGEGEPNTEFWIHARLYAARADVGAVVHAHPTACICLTQIGQPHRVVHNQGVAFIGGVPEFDRVGLIRSRELGDQLAACMGDHVAVMMRGHGMTTAAPDVRTATVAACFLEESADLQLRMLGAAGGDAHRLRVFDADEATRGSALVPPIVARAWEYYAAVARVRPLGG